MTTLTVTRVDEAAARAELRRQIARLEGQLERRAPGIGRGGPHLPTLAELSVIRDALVHARSAERAAATAEADRVAHHRGLLEEAFTDPRRHRGLRIPLAALGEPGCGVYRVRPRLGVVGRLAGWWEITLSSGCPLAMARHHRTRRKEHKPWGRNATLEMIVTALVVVGILVMLAVFLFVYHDVPLRVA